LAELKSAQKEEQTHDTKSFRELVSKDVAEYIKNAEDSALVELYNTISDNEAVYNEESTSILVKTPDTAEIIADAEKAESPEEEQIDEKVVDGVQTDRNTSEPHRPEKADDKEDEDKSDDKDSEGEVPMLDPEFDDDEDMGEDVELPTEDKFTNDLDPQK
jgi:hypothetical protein